MTTRRSFFGWLAGAAAAPTVARDAIANTGGLSYGGRAQGISISGFIGEELRPYKVPRLPRHPDDVLAELMKSYEDRKRFLDSVPPKVTTPRHYVRARALYLPGLPEYVARNKRPRRQEA